MAYCFQLRKKGSEEPEVLQKVDEAICTHLGVEVNPKRWVGGWYRVIGFLIATGAELGSEELREKVDRWYDERREFARRVLKFLEENYESTSWFQRGTTGWFQRGRH